MSALDDAEAEIMEQLCYFRSRIDCLSDDEFLNKIIKTGKQLNDVVPHGNFSAYNIAKSLKDNQLKPTSKQRRALENVWVSYAAQNEEEDE